MAQADEDLDLDVDSPKKSGGGKWVKILLFTLLGLLVIGLSITTTVLLLKSDSGSSKDNTEQVAEESADEPEDEDKPKSKKSSKGKTPTYIEMKPNFVVNLDDPDSNINFLQIGVTLMVYDVAAQEPIKLHTPVIKHHLVQLFGDQKFNDIKTTEGKQKLQEKALEVVQSAMKQAAGDELIDGLFITSIVGQ